MKVLFFADSHSNKADIMKVIEKSKKADLVVCLGDVTFFEHALDLILEDLDTIGKTVLMLPGNHEDEETLKEFCKKTKHVKYFHKDLMEIEGITFFSYGAGGFLIDDPEFDEVVVHFQRELVEAKKLILLTHQPPFNTTIDIVHGKNVGNMNIKDFIKDYKPLYALSGHLHEHFGKKDKIGDTIVLNPGPKGRIIKL
ncbi:hypothetical protein C0585_04900 [Candidatus Woesearchaeota archaeon]|nr:MAG: hypothetical protein C0585_04900 [Candidatus Woesearchaeota archaeon]